MRASSWLPLGLLAVLPGCSGLPFDGYSCTASIERALEVRVEDAATGAPLAAGAIGRARDGAFAEELRVVGWSQAGSEMVATTLGGVDERPGRYDVEVVRAGYARWDTSGVRVRKGPCHVETARLVARLQRLP